jgi:hypothetical protein
MKNSHKLFLGFALFCLALFFLSAEAFAWWSMGRQSHSYLTMLSNMELFKAKLYISDALIKGAKDPDDRSLIQSLSHGSTARRARASFDAACTDYKKEDHYMTATRLARAFHYLQDRADPTKELGGYKDGVRDLAHDLLKAGQFKKTSLWKGMIAHENGLVQESNINNILGRLEFTRKSRASKIKNIYADKSLNEEQKKEKVRYELIKTFSTIAACQNRVINIFKGKCFGYHVVFQITWPTVKEDRKPKRREGESKESWTRRRAAAYKALTAHDFYFQQMPLNKMPFVIHVSNLAIDRYPEERLINDSKWAAKLRLTFKKKEGGRVALDGTLLLTCRGTYFEKEDLLNAHPGLKEKKELKVLNFDSEDGTAEGIEKNNTYVVGPLTRGWSDSDKRASIQFAKVILSMFDCFIAHSVYGDPGAQQVHLFREFRDKVLRKSESGKRLIRLYYEYGPYYAMYLRLNPQYKPYIRTGLDKIAGLITKMDMKDPALSKKLHPLIYIADKTASILWKKGESSSLGEYTKILVPLLWGP